MAWCLAQLADDAETANEVAQVGGVGLLLADMASKPPETGIKDWVAMLAGKQAIVPVVCRSLWRKRSSRPPPLSWLRYLLIIIFLSAECAILAQLCVSDSLQSILVQSNTLFLLGRLLLLAYTQPTVANSPALPTLQVDLTTISL